MKMIKALAVMGETVYFNPRYVSNTSESPTVPFNADETKKYVIIVMADGEHFFIPGELGNVSEFIEIEGSEGLS